MMHHTVKILLLDSGERLPILVNRLTGIPEFYPNLYVVTEQRQINLSTATIKRTLHELSVFLHYLFVSHIDLAERIRCGELLSLGEIDGLARYCRLRFEKEKKEDISETTNVKAFKNDRSKRKIKASQEISLPTAANRIRTIHAYLKWLLTVRQTHEGLSKEVKQSLANIKENRLPTLLARIPVAKGRNNLGDRQGISEEVVNRLFEILDPDSTDNPWKFDYVKKRNSLIVHWLLKLGLRSGELLNIKIQDIDFQKNTVLILRRADDPEDPRNDQPRVKTRERKLPIEYALAAATSDYILKYRSQFAQAKKHPYLFVAEDTGLPMSRQALSKLFRVLREKCPDLPRTLTGHVLRHTWNDQFSKTVAAKQISDTQAEQIRSYSMGWSPNSSTAKTYTRRSVQEKANSVSLELQEKIGAKHE